MSDAYLISAAVWSSFGFVLGFLLATILYHLRTRKEKAEPIEEMEGQHED